MTFCGDRAVGRMRNCKANKRKESETKQAFSHRRTAEGTDSGGMRGAKDSGFEEHAYSADPLPASSYLIARDEAAEEQRRRLLCDMLGPVFFGEREAGTYEELDALFAKRYGIDVRSDFCEGDEHYEEYQEAHQAIAEGLAIYGGAISFGDGALARLAEQLWQNVEEQEKGHFKRINTMLEE